jgi:hypothetical protein
MKLPGNFLNATEEVKKFLHSLVEKSQKKQAVCGLPISVRAQEISMMLLCLITNTQVELQLSQFL